MGQSLYKLAQEDPSFHFSRDDENNQTVIEGMGELHLDIIMDRLRREFKVDCAAGPPQVRGSKRSGLAGTTVSQKLAFSLALHLWRHILEVPEVDMWQTSLQSVHPAAVQVKFKLISACCPSLQVNYRESLSRAADVRYIHKKQSGGSGQFADVQIRFEPGEPGSGFEFVSEIKGGAVPKEFIPGVVKVGFPRHAAGPRPALQVVAWG